MRAVLALPVSWLCYLLGDLASRVLQLRDSVRWADFWYPIYNELMLFSSSSQNWAGGEGGWWPWEPRVRR